MCYAPLRARRGPCRPALLLSSRTSPRTKESCDLYAHHTHCVLFFAPLLRNTHMTSAPITPTLLPVAPLHTFTTICLPHTPSLSLCLFWSACSGFLTGLWRSSDALPPKEKEWACPSQARRTLLFIRCSFDARTRGETQPPSHAHPPRHICTTTTARAPPQHYTHASLQHLPQRQHQHAYSPRRETQCLPTLWAPSPVDRQPLRYGGAHGKPTTHAAALPTHRAVGHLCTHAPSYFPRNRVRCVFCMPYNRCACTVLGN